MRQRAVKLNSSPPSRVTLTSTSCRGFKSAIPVTVYFSAPVRPSFSAFSPYTVRSVIAAALAIPFEQILGGSVER